MIREAKKTDEAQLISIQKECIAGNNIKVITVNTPDFFKRSGMYDDSVTYVSVTDNDIIKGTCSFAIVKCLINGKEVLAGYVYQLFTNPMYCNQGTATELLRYGEEILSEKKVKLFYCLVLEDNLKSMHLLEKQGYKIEKIFRNPYISVYKKMKVESKEYVFRSMEESDLAEVCKLLNHTWKGYEFYQNYDENSLSKEIKRIPGLSYKNIYLLFRKGQLVSCAFLWDWSNVTKVKVKKLSKSYMILRILLNIISNIKKTPVIPKQNEMLHQACICLYGYKSEESFNILLKHINNEIIEKKLPFKELCLLCDNEKVFAKGFISLNANSQMYVKKSFNNKFNSKVWVNGIDI